MDVASYGLFHYSWSHALLKKWSLQVISFEAILQSNSVHFRAIRLPLLVLSQFLRPLVQPLTLEMQFLLLTKLENCEKFQVNCNRSSLSRSGKLMCFKSLWSCFIFTSISANITAQEGPLMKYRAKWCFQKVETSVSCFLQSLQSCKSRDSHRSLSISTDSFARWK